MKGCLKLKSPLPSPSRNCKTVAFGEEEQVYFADVWDRTPTAPARRLTFQDLQELKEIQRSLPLAQQLPDPVSGKMPSQYLHTVPIGLLPLLPDNQPVSPPPPPPQQHTSWAFPSTMRRTPPPPPASTSWVPAHMQHLVPTRAPPQPKKPTFEFLPLLDTPPSSAASSRPTSPLHDDHDHDHDTDDDPPTPSLTNASLESSPLSRASGSESSSPEPEPVFLSLADDDDVHRGRSTTAWHAFPAPKPKPKPTLAPARTPTPSPSPSPSRRKNVMILNGIEIELEIDGDDDDDEPPTPSCALHAPVRFKRDTRAYADVTSPWAG